MKRIDRVPGGVWITLLFTPWIIYWILCSFDVDIGILLALLLSTIIYTISTDKKSIMTLTTLIYFILASILRFIFRSRFLVEFSGPVGYGVLFIMCILSLIFKRPYTYEVSKRDYPEIYWSSPEFLRINIFITAIWSLVFIINAFLTLLPPPIRYASNALIFVGVILSAIFPKAYLRWSVRSLTPPYARWSVGSEGRDVIIVGAGIGGLVCGSLLAKRGYNVLVLEQHQRVGGYCTSFRRGDFTFDGGVESISGLGPNGPLRWLLMELGYNPEELFVRTREALIIGGEWIDIPEDFNDFIDMLCERYPGEADSIRGFFSEVERAYREMYREVEIVGSPLPPSLIAEVLGVEYLLRYPAEHPTFYKLLSSGVTLSEILNRYFRDEGLKTLLSLLPSAYLGTKPGETALSSALPIYGYYIDGGYYPRGGSQRLADLLAEAVERYGGRILTGRKVDSIIVERGKVKGVEVGERIFEAPIVVLNVNAMNLIHLIGEGNLPRYYVSHLKSLKPSVTAFMVYLGLDMDLSPYPALIKSVDDGIGIVINSNLDPNLAPEGCSSLSIVKLLPPEAYEEFGERGTREYRERKRAFAQELIEKADNLLPGIKQHILIQDAATPKTFERYTLNPRGAIYGLDQSKDAPERPYFKTPIKGLYLTGASTFPGGGIEAVTISGIIAANDISGWPKRGQLKGRVL